MRQTQKDFSYDNNLIQATYDEQPQTGHHSTDRIVFGLSAVITLAFVVWGVFATGSLEGVASNTLAWIIRNLGWAFVLSTSGFVAFAVWLACSRFGKILLGQDGEKPEFTTVSWVAMMFSAGMGIGLMFYGVSEPLSHFVKPPPGTVAGGSDQAIQTAMATTLFHWTLHPWAIYAVVGLAIAYSSFRRGRAQLISAAFSSLLGRHAAGPAGRAIDILAIFATLFGSAASLGLGALQIGSGLKAAGWATVVGKGMLVSIILLLTVAFIASAISGVAKGIQWLSNFNMVLAVIFALFIFAVGPTVLILNLIPASIGDYFRELPAMAGRTGASGGAATENWLAAWTIFYWAWWISWTPFVGMFIARISRGRTIRQFVVGVILVPSVVSLLWFAIFGGSAIFAQRSSADLASQATPEGQLFALLTLFPLPILTGAVVMVLVAIFFVSGADAASVVMGTLSQKGSLVPTKRVVAFWGLLMGGVAIVMLLVGGSNALTGMQNLTIIAALPFGLVMVGLCVALARDLMEDTDLPKVGSEAIQTID